MREIKTIVVAGAGTMGSGIAQVAAAAGFQTCLYDIQPEMLDRARKNLNTSLQGQVDKKKMSPEQMTQILGRITFTHNQSDLVADLIIEAIVERLEVKHQFFQAVAAINATDCILSTNTSSIPITRIAAKIPNPERVVGIHFFNPAPVMKLVEIIQGVQTDPNIAKACMELISGMGKTCVLAMDSPGFIVNRVARHFYVEGLKILEEQVADHETIDALIESSGFRMGPFRLMDLIGVDTNFSVTSSMYELFHQDGKFRPSRIQQQKVDAGMHGRKSGKGFYNYGAD